jgi:hypothetical protein
MSYTVTHLVLGYLNPHRCIKCGEKAEGFHDPDECGCRGKEHEIPKRNVPCECNLEPFEGKNPIDVFREAKLRMRDNRNYGWHGVVQTAEISIDDVAAWTPAEGSPYKPAGPVVLTGESTYDRVNVVHDPLPGFEFTITKNEEE